MIKRLITKTFDEIRSKGLVSFFKKAWIFAGRKFNPGNYYDKPQFSSKKKFILFVTGEEKNSTNYYRCYIPLEQIKSQGLDGDVVYYKYLTHQMLDNYEHIIWYRIPLDRELKDYVDILRSLNKKIIFSIDDLLFDEESVRSQYWFGSMHKDDSQNLLSKVRGINNFMKIADLGISSTKTLAVNMQKFIKGDVYVLKNGYSKEQLMISKTHQTWPGIMNMGFFSGSETHDRNLQIIIPTIIKLMEKYPNLRLHLGGRVSMPQELQRFSSRIVRYEFTDMINYQSIISNCAFILNPLEITQHNLAKSETRIIQAALVKRIVIATRVQVFEDIIDGENGILVDNYEWEQAIEYALNNEDNIKSMGVRIYNDIIERYDENLIGKEFINFLNQYDGQADN